MKIHCVCVLVAQSCPTLCDPVDCNPPGSSVHEIFQARILEWVAISFSRGSSQPRDWTWVSCTAGRFFANGATRDKLDNVIPKKSQILSGTTQQRFILIHEISTVDSGDFPGTLISMQWLSHPVSWMIHVIIATLSEAIACLLPQWVKRAITAMKHLGLGMAHSILLVARWPEVVTWQQEQDATLLHTQRM